MRLRFCRASALIGVVGTFVATSHFAGAASSGSPPSFSGGMEVIGGAYGAAVWYPDVLHTPQGYEMWFGGFYQSQNSRLIHATSSDGLSWTLQGPAISPGTGWDSVHVFDASVLYENGAYKAWYTGYGGGSNQVGYATSADGTTWTRPSSDPVLPNGDWDSRSTRVGTVLHDQATGVYRMWFTGASDWYDKLRVGYATSADGVRWTKRAQPVFEYGSTIEWSNNAVDVIRTAGGKYMMFFSSSTNDVRTASSTDGVNWSVDSGAAALSPSASGFDRTRVGSVSVLQEGDTLRMWYGATDGGALTVGYAATTWRDGGGVTPPIHVPPDPTPGDVVLPLQPTVPRIDRIRTAFVMDGRNVPVDLTTSYDSRGRLAAGGPCTVDGASVTVRGTVKSDGSFAAVARRTDGATVTIKGTVGSSQAKVTFRSGKRKTTLSAATTIDSAASSTLSGWASVTLNLNGVGPFDGTADVYTGLTDAVERWDIRGATRRTRTGGVAIQFSVFRRGDGKVLTLRGVGSQNDFSGTVTSRVPPGRWATQPFSFQLALQ